jgi:ABC-type polar amino acid transport system ATPase subunit
LHDRNASTCSGCDHRRRGRVIHSPDASADSASYGTVAGSGLLQARGIHKSFGDHEVLKGIDLIVQRGEHVVICGPSGSGKSTLLRTINLLEEPTAGSLVIDGVEYGPDGEPGSKRGRAIELRRITGMVFQQFNLFGHLTALENIVLPLRSVLGVNRDEGAERAALALQRVGLLRWASHYPAELSGGQQQRVAIARALSLDPRIMLFDEPTSALDPELVGEVLAVMRAVAESGMTMVVVTHELGFAREVGDQCVFMEDGNVVESGGRDLFTQTTNPRTRRFIEAVL